jgi:hypothetical protein
VPDVDEEDDESLFFSAGFGAESLDEVDESPFESDDDDVVEDEDAFEEDERLSFL